MAFKFKQGRVWYAEIWIRGKRIRRALHTNERIAEKKLAELVLERDNIRYGGGDYGGSLKNFVDRYLAWSGAERAKATHSANVRALRGLTAYGASRLDQITPALLDDLKAQWKAAGRGLYVINRDIRAIKTAMAKAAAWGVAKKHDWGNVRLDREPKGRLLFYPARELKGLLTHARGYLLTVGLLCSRAGLRRGEARALRWQDVDFERNRIHVTPYQGWNPKDFERRFIPMAADLRNHLAGLKRSSEHVVMDGERRPTCGGLTSMWRRIVRSAKMTGAIHTLRHTFGAHLAIAGVPLYHISKLMGHSSIRTTEIYAHLSPDVGESAISKLPSLGAVLGACLALSGTFWYTVV